MKLSKIFGALTAAAILFVGTVGVSAASKSTFTEGVDWTKRIITVRGIGLVPTDAVNAAQARGMAELAAKNDAYRKLAELINGVHVDAETTVEKMTTTRDVIKTRVSATINGAQIVDKGFLSDGSYEVYMQIPMFGVKDSLAGAVLEKNSEVEPFPEPAYDVAPSVQQYETSTPVKRRIEITSKTEIKIDGSFIPVPTTPGSPIRIDPTKPALSRLSTGTFDFDNMQPLTTGQAWTQTGAAPVSYETQIDQKVRKTVSEYASLAKGDYTGLVVDCRGLDLQPVMSPVIKNSNGTKIYGHKNLDIDKVISMGMADYVDNLDSVQRAGDNPLVVRATSVENFNSNPVLEVPDSNRVLIENHVTKFLADLKVVFLFDE